MWTYTLRDYDPEAGQTEEDWAREQAAEGWQMWDAGHGAWVHINGRRVKRWSLRRWVDDAPPSHAHHASSVDRPTPGDQAGVGPDRTPAVAQCAEKGPDGESANHRKPLPSSGRTPT